MGFDVIEKGLALLTFLDLNNLNLLGDDSSPGGQKIVEVLSTFLLNISTLISLLCSTVSIAQLQIDPWPLPLGTSCRSVTF